MGVINVRIGSVMDLDIGGDGMLLGAPGRQRPLTVHLQKC